MFVVYLAFTAVFALTYPEKAVSKPLIFDYFVGETIGYSCSKNVCFEFGDIIKIDNDKTIVSIYKNRSYASEQECRIVLAIYRGKIERSKFFPLSSTNTDFGGIFSLGKKDYHAKLKCTDNFMIAKITTI